MGRNVIQFKDKDNNVYDVKDVVARATKADVIINNTEFAPVTSVKDAMGDMPVKTLEVQIDPVQDLHGYENPWPAGGGINKWDEQWEQGSIDNSTGEDKSAATGIRCIGYIPVIPGNSYYFYVGSTDSLRYYWYDSTKEFISSTSVRNSVLTAPSDAYYVRIRSTGDYGDVYKNDISINYPATDTSYHPYSNICPISGWTSADVGQAGKNLFDKNIGVTTGKIRGDDGTESSSGTSSYTNAIGGFEGETKYTITGTLQTGTSAFRVYYLDKYKNWISRSGASSTVPSTFTTPAGCRYVQVQFITNAADFNTVQIEKGSSASSYKAYEGKTTTYNFPEEAGTVYGATLTIHQDWTGTLLAKRAEDDLGARNWTVSGDNISFLSSSRPSGDIVPSSQSEMPKVICDIYRPSPIIDQLDMSIAIATSGKFKIRDSRFAQPLDATAFKTAMNGVKAVYELAEPVSYELTAQQVVSLLKGVNNVWADTGNTAIEYAADTKLYIDGKIAELQALILES